MLSKYRLATSLAFWSISEALKSIKQSQSNYRSLVTYNQEGVIMVTRADQLPAKAYF